MAICKIWQMSWVVAIAVGVALGGARCEDYPSRPVTLVVPYAPGGGTDVLARMLAQELRDRLKQPFVVENRPGAATQTAAAAVAKTPPDGYTLLMSSSTTMATNVSIYKSLPYDPINDFAPIALVGSAYFLLVANPSVPARTLPELIAYIKSQPPGSLSYGTSGAGTPHHLFMELFMKMTGTKMQQVPYRGSAPALTDVISGVIPMMIVDLTPALPLITDGRIRAFGVTAASRVKTAPDISTIAEAGLPGYAAQGWFGIVARVGTPKPIIDTLNSVLTTYLKRPDVQDRLYNIGIQPLTSTPEEFEKFIPQDIKKWAQVAKDAGIQPIE
jgi:tripartite-type tricarboxylate transporter receptor subunit TctC